LEPERVRDPAGDHAGESACESQALEVLRGAALNSTVVLKADAREHPGVAAAQRARVEARVLERLPRRLQQQPLLRVPRQRLARPDAEEGRVEVAGVVHEAALAR